MIGVDLTGTGITDKNSGTDKKVLRKTVLALRERLNQEERQRAAFLLTERILGHQWFYRSDYILCFASYGSEIDTWDIMKEALRLGKEVYIPKVLDPDTAWMEFYKFSAPEELEKGYRGIPEPSGISQIYPYSEETAEHTLMLMPGVAFDRYRNRLGYGKGFYDRYLCDRAALQLRTIAVGYQCQLVDELPVSDGDIKPYQVICV